jgi:hypothetical protein
MNQQRLQQQNISVVVGDIVVIVLAIGLKNSDGEHNRSGNGRSCMGRFLRYHPITAASKQ